MMIAQGTCVCNRVLRLSAGQGLFPPHCATGLSMFLGTPDLAHLPKICIFFHPVNALHLTYRLIHKQLTIHLKPDNPAQAL